MKKRKFLSVIYAFQNFPMIKLFSLLLIFTIGFTFTVCKTDTSVPDSWELYYGTWKNGNNDIVKINANKLEFYDGSGGLWYRIENLTWTPHDNGDAYGSVSAGYTTGYTIKGTLTYLDNSYGSGPEKEDGNVGVIGDIVFDNWYIHTNKKSLDHGWNTYDQGDNIPFLKQ